MMIPYRYALHRRCMTAGRDVTVNISMPSEYSNYAEAKMQSTGDAIAGNQALRVPKGTVLQFTIRISGGGVGETPAPANIRDLCKITLDGETFATLPAAPFSYKTITYTVTQDCSIVGTNESRTAQISGGTKRYYYGVITITTR